MRRGHHGIGGWRNENARHFRPRSGGTPHFRPPRPYGVLLRFPLPNARPHNGPTPYRPPLLNSDNTPVNSEHDRMTFRVDNRSNTPRPSERDHPRSNYPILERMRHSEHNAYPNQYQERRGYYDAQPESCHVSSMGDVDDRCLMSSSKSELYFTKHHRIPPWTTNEKHSYYDDRNYNKTRYEHNEGKVPSQDYIGHRPPASDHYGGTGTADNSNSFTRSVDDTVDIVRKRLLNRIESHPHTEDQIDEPEDDARRQESTHHSTQNTPAKKRMHRQRISNVKTNCDKIKNNIVHQLFKMDKDKIHKLMDNPNSSTKFEYAISSLITESQNSLNRHLRSVAEKSLTTTSSDFIHDNNTIYEDTFMKQMQCLLDPQDTLILEDIKPFVMAELSKVLQIDDYYEHSYDNPDDHANYYQKDDTPILDHSNYDEYANQSYYEGNNPPHNYEEFQTESTGEDFKFEPEHYEDKPLFQRRQDRVSRDHDKERRLSIEKRKMSSKMSMDTLNEPLFATPEKISIQTHSKTSIDGRTHEEHSTRTTDSFFDSNTEQFSDDDDPFAELDQQYHVAVDPNFIQTYDSSPQPSISSNRSKSPVIKKEVEKLHTSDKDSTDIKNEIDSQLQSIAQSPLKLHNYNDDKSMSTTNIQIKQEITTPVKQPDTEKDQTLRHSKCKKDHMPQKEIESSGNLTAKPSAPASSRKRSLDQRSSHRKEKRKKCDPNDSNQQILNKNIIINVNDCAAKKTETCTEAAKSIFNLFFSKDDHRKELPKDSNKTESVDKSYSDKYVKRKDQAKSSKEKPPESKKRHHSTSSSSHSMLSPKDNSKSSDSQKSTTDTKNKLKDINMFMEHPRKSNTVHQAHRNTAVSTKISEKPPDENKTKIPVIHKIIKPIHVKKLQSKETQTLDSKKHTRFTQTDRKKLITRSMQTDPVVFEKSASKATDGFERMKEIDLEIQVLLQEKFKLYNSMESKDPNPNTMQTLGMTVLNVNSFEEENAGETETISLNLDEYIPVEELEQIALENVQLETPKNEKRQRRKKLLDDERLNSASAKKNMKKTKTPNISLLEQIITDDRPIEDIISLDDLESSPVVKSKKKGRNRPKAAKKKTNKAAKAKKTVCNSNYKLRECSVLLNRHEIYDYYTKDRYVKDIDTKHNVKDTNISEDNEVKPNIIESKSHVGVEQEKILETVNIEPESNIVEESVVNDIHFDMLDVSEDIVIGDVCEVKTNGDKDAERMEVAICEEIILDNSQSSVEDVLPEAGHADNQCKMYDYSTDESLRRDSVTVTGNADAVLAIECIDNSFLAACLDGNVYYFNSDGQLITTLRGSNLAVTCLTIVEEKYGTTVYTGSLDSRIRYYDLETGMEKGPECNVLSPIQTMDRAWDTVFVGTRTGFVLQFECKNNMLIPVSTVKFSEQSILALRALKEGPRKVLLVAARSEDVTIKDAQTGLLLRTLVGPKMTVYTLLYEDGKVYCGTSSHQIHVFDYASGSHNGVHEGGKGAVCLRATGGLLFAGCYDGCVYIYREGEPRPLAQLRGPSVMLLSLAVVGSKIIAGYKDRGLYIWKIPLGILQEMIL